MEMETPFDGLLSLIIITGNRDLGTFDAIARVAPCKVPNRVPYQKEYDAQIMTNY